MTTLTLVKKINSDVNRLVNYQSDASRYNRLDFWVVAQTEGDCEDYALRKRLDLVLAGIPIDSLRLCCCWTEQPGPDNYHAILIYTDENGNDWILDNRQHTIMTHEEVTRIGYVLEKIQVRGRPEWEYVKPLEM